MHVLFSSLLKLPFFHPQTASRIKKLASFFFFFFWLNTKNFPFLMKGVDFYSY